MASIEKYTKTNANKIIRHILRLNNTYKNQDIDLSKSKDNHVLINRGYQYYQQRLSEVFCQNRKDVNTLVGAVVTLPKELLVYDKATQYEILRQVSIFLVRRYDPTTKNTVAATIHADEKGEAPHMHYCFIPVVADERRGEKVSAFQLITRQDLKTLHRDLKNFLNQQFGSPIGDYFYTGVTKRNGRNLTVDEIKQLDQVQELNKQIEELKSENMTLQQEVAELSDKLAEYEREVEVEWEF